MSLFCYGYYLHSADKLVQLFLGNGRMYIEPYHIACDVRGIVELHKNVPVEIAIKSVRSIRVRTVVNYYSYIGSIRVYSFQLVCPGRSCSTP